MARRLPAGSSSRTRAACRATCSRRCRRSRTTPSSSRPPVAPMPACMPWKWWRISTPRPSGPCTPGCWARTPTWRRKSPCSGRTSSPVIFTRVTRRLRAVTSTASSTGACVRPSSASASAGSAMSSTPRACTKPRRCWSATTTSPPSAPPNASRRRRCATSSSCRWSATGPYVDIRVRANAFLHHMVRNIAGSLILVGRGERHRRLAAGGPARAATVARRAPRHRRKGCISPAPTTPPDSGCLRVNSGVRPRECRVVTWFEKIIPSRIKTERRSRSVPEGLWIKCPACDAVLYRAELERNLQVCPKCSHHLRIEARDRLMGFLDEGTRPRTGERSRAGRSAQVPRQQEVPRPPDRRAEDGRREGRDDRHGGRAARHRHRRLRVRVPFPRRLDGIGRRRALHARRRVLPGQPAAADLFLVERRRAHAGRPAVAAADEQDQCGAVAHGAGAAAVRFRADRPDHGRRVGEPRDARRPQHRRAARADRLCRPARDRADRARDAAGRLPAQRIPARARRDRPDRRPPRPARPHRDVAGGDARTATARAPGRNQPDSA